MPWPTNQPGKIFTFYSYKGGTGRSMAVANVSCLLAKSLEKTSQRVLVMDWDLEAPGLHRFFSAKCDLPEYESMPGVIDYFSELQKKLAAEMKYYEGRNDSGPYNKLTDGEEGWKLLDQMLPLDRFVIPDVVLGVDFIRAGRFDPGYAKLVGSFNWIQFFKDYGEIFRTFRELLAQKYAYTIVDSRTGVTDVSGVCTTILPEKVVGVFTPNRQSLSGLANLVTEAVTYRRHSDDLRPLAVFPLPSRVENAEKDLREQWRKDYQAEFEEVFRNAHGLEKCDLSDYFDNVLLPHVSYYAYGENIAVLQERHDAISLSAAYQRFFDRFMNSNVAWQKPGEEEEEAAPEAVEAMAEPAALSSSGPPGYDAYLAYDSSDREQVKKIATELTRNGARIWVDYESLAPGEHWETALEDAMAESKTILVFAGAQKSGPWTSQSMAVMLEALAKNSTKPIIPVFLPDAPNDTRLPLYLQRRQAVDLRKTSGDEHALETLIWAVTGKLTPSSAKAPRAYRLLISVIGYAAIAFFAFTMSYNWLASRGYVGAIPKYKAEIAQNPDNVDAHGQLANAYRKVGFNDKAIVEYEAALKLKPDDAGNFGSLAELVDGKGSKEAIKWYRDYLKKNPDDGQMRMRLADQLKFTSNWKEAVDEARQAVKTRNGDIADNHTKLATMLEVVGDYQGALDEFRAAHDDDQVKQLSRALGMFPWGIMLSSDKDIYPTHSGGPSAAYEIELALRNRLPNIALYQRPNWYGTVVQFDDQASAMTMWPQIKTLENGRWKTANLIQLDRWCASVGYVEKISVTFDEQQVPVSLLNCSVSQSPSAGILTNLRRPTPGQFPASPR